ncbi:NUDIX domain-containing protein [Microbacterium sp. NPDC055312]
MSRITFVRHAQPDVDPSLDPSAWPLSSSGATAAAALDLNAGPCTVISTSPERKAADTVMAAVRSERMLVDPRFREVDRVESVHDGFRDARRAWIGGRLDERHEGWETPNAAARRFHEGLLTHQAEHLIVGTHGMVLTAWMVGQGLIPSGDAAVEFWEQLRFPEVIELTLPLVRVRAVLTDGDGRFVLIKRTHPGQAPYWTTPGGGVMLSDRSHEDALRRELREELGAAAELGGVLHERQLDSTRSEVFYAATLMSIDPTRADGPEYDGPSRGRYDVERVMRDELNALDLRPNSLKELLLRPRYGAPRR